MLPVRFTLLIPRNSEFVALTNYSLSLYSDILWLLNW